MIYIKNTTTKQEIWIPRNEVDINVIPTPKTYEEGYKEGQKDGKQEGIDFQKDQLLNLYVTENGIYEREDGYGKVTVVIGNGETDCKEAIEDAYEDGYKEGYEDGAASTQINLENKSIDIVSNGEYTVTPTDGFDALESVKISVDVQNGVECNLEDKIICPQTNEVDGYGYIYIRPNEGYDGMVEVAVQTADLKNGWYNEGYEQGKCNLSHQLEIIETNGRHLFYPQNNGWDGYDFFEVEVDVPTTAKLQDVWVTPSMADRDGNNLLVYSPNTDEGYDGLSRVVIDPQTIYNEGKAESYATISSFNKIAMEIKTNSIYNLEILNDSSFVNTSGEDSPKVLLYDAPVNYIWSYKDVTNGISDLRQNAFRDYSKISKVKLNTIMILGERAFKNAYNLEEVEFSGVIGRIGTEAFDGCSNLSKIICRATGNVVLGSAPFNGLPQNGVLQLMDGVDETPWLEKLPNGWVVEKIMI